MPTVGIQKRERRCTALVDEEMDLDEVLNARKVDEEGSRPIALNRDAHLLILA